MSENQPKPKEQVIVKKGFFYLIFQAIALPFKLIYWLGKIAYSYIRKQWELYMLVRKARKKAQELYKLMNAKPLDDEVL